MDGISDSMAWLAKRDGSIVIGHGPFTESATPAGETSFYVQDFALEDPKPWKTPTRIDRLNQSIESTSAFPICDWTAPDAAPFSMVFQEIMSAIHGGRFEKTVPVVTEAGEIHEDPAYPIATAMLAHRHPLHSYGWINGDKGFAGATPEVLFTLSGSRLETMALAGTARSDDRDVFAVDEKEIREHEYVAQTIVSKLVDMGKIDRGGREILDLGHIVHFITRISLELSTEQTPDKLIRLLHPTPALGPLPRTSETLALLLDWRTRLGCPAQFGAPFGLLDGGDFQSIVAIRGVWWKGRNLTLPAGCGIIEASRLVNEWRELRLKREAVKRLLNRA